MEIVLENFRAEKFIDYLGFYKKRVVDRWNEGGKIIQGS